MKTKLTIQMEESLYYHCRQNGDVVVEEVTLPEEQGIVDTLSCRLDEHGLFQWRCYELKISKADFRSNAKLSFIGHYNYFVVPEALFLKVKEEIPTHVGVMVYHPYLEEENYVPGFFRIVKKPQRQNLGVNEVDLLYRLILTQAREVGKAKKAERGLRAFRTQQLYDELKKRQNDYDLFGGGSNYYDRFIEDTHTATIEALKEELEATREAYFNLEKQLLEER